MRAELLAGLLRNERRYVANEQRVVVGIAVWGGERADGPSGHREWGHGVNQSLLQLEQCRRWPGDNTRHANTRAGGVIVLEGLQLHAGDVGIEEDLFGRGIDLIQTLCADEPLNERDVRTMCLIQGEPLREDLEQAGVVGLGVTQHGGVRFQQDVDGGDGVLYGHNNLPLGLRMRWENDVPVAFHADYGDTVLVRPFQRFVKRTQPKL